ncbi:MAG: G5 domain-containing protein [Clostridia bacterium]|nr:G5 domain-containing protein [Clostridia bacterium]
MNKKHKKRSRDSKIFGRVSLVITVVLITLSLFFLYDIVLIAMADDNSDIPASSEGTDITEPPVSDPVQVVTEEPIKMYISDKTVYLAHLRADGKSYTFPFKVDEEATVQTLLDRAGIEISENDYINLYEVTTPLFEDIYVEIGRITYEEVTETVSIPYSTEYVDVIYSVWAENNIWEGNPYWDKYKPKDIAGEDGTKTITKRIKYVNGKEDTVTILSEKITKQPTTAVIHRDMSHLLDLGDGAPTKYVAKLDVSLTAYAYEEVGGQVTYTGDPTQVGYVAVDRNVIPMHSYLYIVTDDGFVYGYCYAKDTGGAIKGNKIDLFLPSMTDMNNFGRVNGTVYIITYGAE